MQIRGARVGMLLSVAYVASARSSGADAAAPRAPVATVITLEAARHCASEEDLQSRIAERLPNVRFVAGGSAQDGSAYARVHAALDQKGATSRVHAHLTVRRPGEPPHERTVDAEDCDEALEALAFMTAVILDPAPDRQSAPPEPEVSSTQPTSSEISTEQPEEQGKWVLLLGAGLHVAWGAAPKPLLGPEIVGGVSWRRSSIWSPSLRVGVAWSTHAGVDAPGGTAHFSLLSAHLEVCPLELRASALHARPCAFVAAGQLRAEGSNTVDPQHARRPWGMIGGGIRLGWDVTERWRVTGMFRLGRIAQQDTFAFEPVAFHETPTWAPSGGLGLELLFP